MPTGSAGAAMPGSCPDGAGSDVQLDQFHLPYTTPDNYTVASATVSSFICPSEKDSLAHPGECLLQHPPWRVELWLEHGRLVRVQLPPADHAGRLQPQHQPQVRHFTDGTSNTVLASEVKIRNPSTTAVRGSSRTSPTRPVFPIRRPIPSPSLRNTAVAVGQSGARPYRLG